MALPILPLLAVAAIAMFAGGTKKKTKSTARPTQWLKQGDPCDPLNPGNVPPGFGCFASSDGNYFVMEEHDPSHVAVDYGELGDDQGVAEALDLLDFSGPSFATNVAQFQKYVYDYFDLDEGSLRFDGRIDNKTLRLLEEALADYEDGEWVTPQEFALQEALADNEYDNATTVVSGWKQDPLIAWEFPDGDVAQPLPGGQSTSSWLTNLAYWGTYDVAGPDEPGASMPKKFWPVQGTPQYDAEAGAREIWLRIHQYVMLIMEEMGVPDATIFPEK